VAVEVRRVLAIQAWHVQALDGLAADGAGHFGGRSIAAATLALHAVFEPWKDQPTAGTVTLHVEATNSRHSRGAFALAAK